jgi:hypothetical protein
MTTHAELWHPHSAPLAKFEPVARYIAPMDCLIYLREDCSYRAVRLNAYTTVLLHPYEDRPVGVKLKGMRFLHERLKAIFKAVHGDAGLEINLEAFWEVALTADGNESIERAEGVRQSQLKARAREVIKGAKVEALDFQVAA